MEKPGSSDEEGGGSVPSTQLVDSNDDVRLTDPRVGTVLADRYMVLKRLGQGGMARVYLARHQIIGRAVAIKILLPHLVEDANVVRRFVNEARAAGMIGHPNIVESVDIGTTNDGLPFLVLEYLEGTCLTDEVRRLGQLPVERSVGIALQVASALGAAHAQKIIHRDLKSENVYLIERDGRADHVKVLDFGVSKFAGIGEGKAFTAQGAVLGTPECMAPEQFVDPDRVDARIDVYALGVLLYELLAGRTPFAGIPFPKVMHSIVNDEPPPIATHRPDVPEELDALVRRMMAKFRDDRPATMDEVYELLLPFAGKSPPPRFQARGSTPDGQMPMTYRLPPRAGSSSSPREKATKPEGPARAEPSTSGSMPAASSPSGTLVSGPVGSANAPTERRAHVPVVHVDTRSTESATAGPATPRAPSRPSLWIALAVVMVGAPATYLALRAAKTNETTTTTTESNAHATPTTSTAPSASSSSTTSAQPTIAAPASTSAAPAASVALAVICPLPNARVTFRGRTSALPFTEIVPPGTQTEPVEVTAEGHEGRRYFVRVDHAMSIVAKLPKGKAIVVDATAAETDAALGLASAEGKPTTTPTSPNATTTTSVAPKPSVDISLDR